ncbi:hypothetical protein UCDDA912_g04127 [Diaporthe ampelina]|uniref:Uncharacterized protein n=1 Tax=Diaporthe ampelina TaxID=1214573 RepID=A0A0G2I7U8_9PEZI|nr:hypothetical protein UCDDA912_g04127 [Diaporthe ampelina]
MPEVVQRALGALNRLLTMLVVFGEAYILSDSQIDPIPALLVPIMWFTFCYMYLFPTSSFSTGFVDFFDEIGPYGIALFASTFSACFLWHLLYERSPAGMFHAVGLLIIHHGISLLNEQKEQAVLRVLEAAKSAVMNRAGFLLHDTPQPDARADAADAADTADAADAGAESSADNDADTANEATPTSEQEHSIERDQSTESVQSTEPELSVGPRALVTIPDGSSTEKVVEPSPRARITKRTLWSFLVGTLKLGFAALLTHIAINVLFMSSVVNSVPMGNSTLFGPGVEVQANKTQNPFQVPAPEFITNFGSPCQVAPTPTPVAKSTWMAAAMSTPMPTPMPQPTPSPLPTSLPEPKPHDEALDLLNRLFDFSIFGPKPLLEWYFSRPLWTQYAVVSLSLLALWYLPKPVTVSAAHLALLAIDYLAAAAILPVLLSYGFTSKQSLNITLAADLGLSLSIWWAAYCLWNLGAVSKTTAAGLAQHSILFQDMLAQTKLRIDGTEKSIAAIYGILDRHMVCFTGVITGVNEQDQKLKQHAIEIDSLYRDVENKADIEQTTRILEQIYEKIDVLENSKADAPTLLEAQLEMCSLHLMVANLRTKKADATDIVVLQKVLEEINSRIDELQNTTAHASDIADLDNRLSLQVKTVADMLRTQGQIYTDVANLKVDMDKADLRIDSLGEDSDEHDSLINSLDGEVKAAKKNAKDLKSQVINDRKKADEKMSKLEEENADLKGEVGQLKSCVTDMQKQMDAMATSQLKQEDLLQLQKDVASDADQKVSQLRSETEAQHDKATQARRELEASVDTRFAQSNKAVKDLEKEAKSHHNGLSKKQEELCGYLEGRLRFIQESVEGVQGDLDHHKDDVRERFDKVDKKVAVASDGTSKALKLAEAVQPGRDGWIAESRVDGYIRDKVNKFMEEFMVSDRFRAAVNDAQLTKKQLQRNRLRNEVYELTADLLDSEEVQAQIYTKITERQALNHPPGDPPGVISDGRASSPGIGPSNSPAAIEGPSHHGAAADNTTGNDEPLGEPPGVFPGGRATDPGSMSSDDTTTPTIPEESTTPDDVEDHHGTRGVPLGDPPGVRTSRRATGLDGTRSNASSGDDGGNGPRHSSEDDDGTLLPTQRVAKGPGQPDILPNAPGTPEQPGGEQDEEEDEETDEETDEEEDDDTHHGGDDDESGDDGPPGSPRGSGGFHGHNGTGGGDDDEQGGDDGGAPSPPSDTGDAGDTLGPYPRTNNSRGQTRDTGGHGEAQDDEGNDAQHPAAKKTRSRAGKRNAKAKGRVAAYFKCRKEEAKEKAEDGESKEAGKKAQQDKKPETQCQNQALQSQPKQQQNWPAQRQNQPPTHSQSLPREWEIQLRLAQNQPLRWPPQPTQGQSQQTGDGQDYQHKRRHRRRGKGGKKNGDAGQNAEQVQS